MFKLWNEVSIFQNISSRFVATAINNETSKLTGTSNNMIIKTEYNYYFAKKTIINLEII